MYLDTGHRATPNPVPAQRMRVLFVATRPALIEPVRRAVKADGRASFRLCADPAAAAAAAARCGADAVLLDPALPGRAARQLVETLRADPATGGIAIVVLGDRSVDRTRAFSERMEADGASEAPGRPGLVESIRACLHTRRNPRAA